MWYNKYCRDTTRKGSMSVVILFAAAALAYGYTRYLQSDDSDLPLITAYNTDRLPTYFKYKEALLTDTRDQGHCASCWAFSLTSAIADTLAVRSGGAWKKWLSPQFLLSCTGIAHSCEVGASPEDVYTNSTVLDEGIPLDTDFAYQGTIVPCQYSNQTGLRVHMVPHSGISLCVEPKSQRDIDENILRMKYALVNHGPVVGTLKITQKLVHYNPVHHGVFTEDADAESLGQHAIEIIGYCDANVNTHEPEFYDLGYWVIRNSYGKNWGFPSKLVKGGENAFAYVAMGNNTNLIESRASIVDVYTPQCLIKAVKNTNRSNTCYTSYNQYSQDPERQHFIEALK
jgi:C1A family cysteine protease